MRMKEKIRPLEHWSNTGIDDSAKFATKASSVIVISVEKCTKLTNGRSEVRSAF